jgi:hypothetical protein
MIYTNNSKQYVAVPTFGADLGMAYSVTPNFSIAVENRWMLTSKPDPILNDANYPRAKYAYISVGVHFSLPWQSQESAYDDARIEYDKKSASFEETRWELMERIHEIDSLNFENSELKKDMESMTVRVKVDTVKVLEDLEVYDPAKKAESPEYLFTKDPFKSGSLVNDGYLKNVLIDILDDEYVWQISAKLSRKGDAEKIRNFFAAYNGAMSRRIALRTDESVNTFKLTCLGKVKGAAAGTKKK